ncbi:MAG: non-ribosomal peptide synthetase, partial [bacterium]|nr:non-ribosomal peptide synthetase [bacterium]
LIKKSSRQQFPAVTPAEKREYHPLSSAQKRLYILQSIEPDAINYNIPKAVYLEGRWSVQRLQQVFNQLLDRHESLRTSFVQLEDEPVQIIHHDIDFQPTVHDCVNESYDPSELCSRLIRPFDLSRAPLLRVELIKIARHRHIMMVDMHHIITDGTSMGILFKEFTALYAGEILPPPGIQYKDFSQCGHHIVHPKKIASQADYWLKQFEKSVPELELPADHPLPAQRTHKGGTLDFELPPSETAALKSLALEEGATLFMLLLALY